MNSSRMTWHLGALVAGLVCTFAAEARKATQLSSFATQSEAEAEAKSKAVAAPAAPTAEDDGSLFDEQAFAALASQSSFPLRLSYGAGGDDTWLDLPAAVEPPKPLRRRYSANKCEFTLTAEAFSVRRMEQVEGDYAIVEDSFGPQSIVDAPRAAPLYVTLAAELGIKMGDGSEEHCRKVFAGRKVRFATIALDGGSIYAENRAGARLNAEAVTVPGAVEVYLSWDEHKKTMRVTDRAGLALAVETGVQGVPAAQAGVYYLAYEPAWTIERAGKHLAAK